MELGEKSKKGHASIYHHRANGVKPVHVPFPYPLYDNLIVLHEPSSSDDLTAIEKLNYIYGGIRDLEKVEELSKVALDMQEKLFS